MFDKENLTLAERAEYALGETLYKELTANGANSISINQAATLKDCEINAIVEYSFLAGIDFESDSIATQSVENIMCIAVERNPSDISVEEKLQHFKRSFDKKPNEAMFEERNKLLKVYMALGMDNSTLLELIEPMKNMSEEEKEAFAKDLRIKLEKENLSRS